MCGGLGSHSTGVGLVLYAQMILVGEYWWMGSICAVPFLLLFVPWLALKSWRGYRRYRRLCKAQIVMGILQCISAEYAPGGESICGDYKVWLGCVFHTPAGRLISKRFSRLVLPMSTIRR